MSTDEEAQIEAALAVVDRLRGQRATSTPRRDQFTITRRETDALIKAGRLIQRWVR